MFLLKGKYDNGKEYFNIVLDEHFLENGIVQNSYCPNTPKQNGIAERRKIFVLEVIRVLLFSN
jgi:uncharacterized hydantoinase/oxoprolinase family protein